MNYKILKKRMDVFFKETSLDSLIEQIEDMGYVVEDMNEEEYSPSVIYSYTIANTETFMLGQNLSFDELFLASNSADDYNYALAA